MEKYSNLLEAGGDMARTPISEQVQVNFRMPVELRDRIKAAADDNGRSMNAEIIIRLDRTFEPPVDMPDIELDAEELQQMDKIMREFASLLANRKGQK